MPLRPAAAPLLVTAASRELLTEIRVASLHHFACERRLRQFHLGVVGLLVVAALVALIVSGLLFAFVLVAAAAAAHVFLPWRSAADRHGHAGRRLFVLGRELCRLGPALTPAAFCALRVRVDLVSTDAAPGAWRPCADTGPIPARHRAELPSSGHG